MTTTCDILGPIQLVTASTGSVLTLAEVKQHVRVEGSFVDDDSLLTNLIAVATRYVEHEIYGARQLLTATYDVLVREWWDCLDLPRPPLQSVTSVKYYDTSGTQQTVASSTYIVTVPMRLPGSIDLAPLAVWPTYQAGRAYPITVRFVCGYGASTAVPQLVKQALLVAIGELYNSREAGVLGVSAGGSSLSSTMSAVRWLLEADGWGSYQ